MIMETSCLRSKLSLLRRKVNFMRRLPCTNSMRVEATHNIDVLEAVLRLIRTESTPWPSTVANINNDADMRCCCSNPLSSLFDT